MWKCPKCRREFTRKNQRHSCGTGSRADVLRDRPEHVVECYQAIEAYVQGLGGVEVVAKERYVLFRTRRVFTDLSIMKDAVRIAIHIGRQVNDPLFIKIVKDEKSVTHVAKVRNLAEFEKLRAFVKEAHEYSTADR